jgi:hypothetical protein
VEVALDWIAPSSHSGSQDTFAVLPLGSGGAVEVALDWIASSSHSGSQDTFAVLPLGSGGAVDEAGVGWTGRVTYRRERDECGWRICWVGSGWRKAGSGLVLEFGSGRG